MPPTNLPTSFPQLAPTNMNSSIPENVRESDVTKGYDHLLCHIKPRDGFQTTSTLRPEVEGEDKKGRRFVLLAADYSQIGEEIYSILGTLQRL